MRKILSSICILTAVFSMALPIPASAEKPAWAGSGGKHDPSVAKGNKGKGAHQQGIRRARKNGDQNWNNQAGNSYPVGQNYPPRYFDDRQRTIIRDYFGPRFQSGRCPPGLAKKYNGCMPPGQAKKWAIGYPLPRNVIFYDLPPPLLGQLGYPAPGYRYVRVAADVLLIAAGTGMVVAAMEDLSSM